MKQYGFLLHSSNSNVTFLLNHPGKSMTVLSENEKTNNKIYSF